MNHDADQSTTSTGDAQSNTNLPKVSDLFRMVEHRFDDEPVYQTKEHYSIQSSSLPEDHLTQKTIQKIEKLETIATNSSSSLPSAPHSRNKNIANKTKQILMKNRAIGNDQLPSERRFYLELQFLASGQTKFFYFSQSQTVGEVVEILSSLHSLLAYKTPSRPNDLSLAFISSSPSDTDATSLISSMTPDDLQILLMTCDRNQLISQQFEEFSSLYLVPVPLDAVIRAQSTLQKALDSSIVSEDPIGKTLSPSTQEPIPSLSTLAPLPAPYEYAVGDSIRYLPSTAPYPSAADGTWWGCVLAVHRDDVLPYYTIRIINSITGSSKEKQTDSNSLSLSYSPLVVDPPASPNDTEYFPVKLSFQGRSYRHPSIPVHGTVLSLKISIIQHLQHLLLPETSTTSSSQSPPVLSKELNIFNMKLIYKGKILKTNDMLLRGGGSGGGKNGLHIADGGTIMILKETK
jgi:hypothetical protein